MEKLILTWPAMLFTVPVLHPQDGNPLKLLLTLRARNIRRGLLTGKQWSMSSSAPLIGSECSDRGIYQQMVGSRSTDCAPEDLQQSPEGSLMVLIRKRARASYSQRELSMVIRCEPGG
jgi:hypothetical protein